MGSRSRYNRNLPLFIRFFSTGFYQLIITKHKVRVGNETALLKGAGVREMLIRKLPFIQDERYKAEFGCA